jgi:hypothetical protein
LPWEQVPLNPAAREVKKAAKPRKNLINADRVSRARIPVLKGVSPRNEILDQKKNLIDLTSVLALHGKSNPKRWIPTARHQKMLLDSRNEPLNEILVHRTAALLLEGVLARHGCKDEWKVAALAVVLAHPGHKVGHKMVHRGCKRVARRVVSNVISAAHNVLSDDLKIAAIKVLHHASRNVDHKVDLISIVINVDLKVLHHASRNAVHKVDLISIANNVASKGLNLVSKNAVHKVDLISIANNVDLKGLNPASRNAVLKVDLISIANNVDLKGLNPASRNAVLKVDLISIANEVVKKRIDVDLAARNQVEINVQVGKSKKSIATLLENQEGLFYLHQQFSLLTSLQF